MHLAVRVHRSRRFKRRVPRCEKRIIRHKRWAEVVQRDHLRVYIGGYGRTLDAEDELPIHDAVFISRGKLGETVRKK